MEDFPNNPTNENQNIEQNNADQNDIEQTDATEAIDREDALYRGDKTNDVVLVTSSATEPRDEEKWMEEHHPALYREMKDNDAPFNPGEFEKQGFAFAKDDKGNTHVLFPTPEYKEWLEKPEDERGSRPVVHHDTITDKAMRPEMERVKPWMDNKVDELGQLISEKLLDGLKGCTWKERMDVLKSVERYQGNLRVNTKDVYKHKINELVEGYIPVKEDEDRSVEIDQEKIWNSAEKTALYESSPIYPYLSDDYTPYPYLPLRRKWTEGERRKHHLNELALEIKNQLWEDYQTKNKGKISEELKGFNATDQASEIAKQRIMDSLENGCYFKYNNRKNVKLSDKFLELYGIDKNDPAIISAAWRYADNNDQYIGMSDHVVEQALSSTEYPIKYDFYSHRTRIGEESRSGYYREKFDKKITEKLKRIVSERVESLGIRQEAEYVNILEKSKKEATEQFFGGIKEEVYLGGFLKTRTVEIGTLSIEKYLEEKYGRAFGEFGVYPLVHDEVAEINQDHLKKQLGKRFVEILEIGAENHTPDYDKKYTDYFVMQTFNPKDLANVEQNLDLDLSNPEIFNKSISGFLNTLKGVNGEASEQANWYYENIFAKNPDEFYSRMIDLKKNKDCPRSLKAKITKFMNANESYQEYEQKRLFEKMARDAERKERSSTYRSILRNASGEEINELIRKRQEELVGEIKEAGAEEVETFYARSKRLDAVDSGDELKAEAPKDFGVRKVEMLKTWKEYIEANYFNDASEENKPKFFIDTFPVANVDNGKLDNVVLDDDLSYIGFQFEYEGNLCVIAESFNVDAGMYLFRGKPGDNFKEMFDGSKANSLKDPRVVRVDHLGRDNMEDSIDLAYQKAFLYLRTGDKSTVHYNKFGDSGREDWGTYQSIEYPAWPLNIEREEIDPGELERYREWQRRQEENI